MVLGAGPAQTPGILKAVAAGHHVLTVDPYPDSPGHGHGHGHVRLDTRDTQGVLAAARALAVDGLCAFRSDVATATVHRVRAALGLPGGYPEAAAVMTDKGAFRQFQRAEGLPCPAFALGAEADALHRRAAVLTPPLFCKPVDNCGSRGIVRLDDLGRTQLAAALAHALEHSPAGRVCLEEALPGVEMGGDALLAEGTIVSIAVTRKYLDRQVVTGHRLPDGRPEAEAARIETALEEACKRLGYRDGPLNFDVMVTPETVTIIEMSPRNGGNGLTDLIRLGASVDMEERLVDAALGRPLPALRPTPLRGAGVVLLGSRRAGHLERLPDLEQWRNHCPEVVDVVCGKRPGDRVEPFTHNGHALGHVLFRCRDEADYARIARRLAEVELPVRA